MKTITLLVVGAVLLFNTTQAQAVKSNEAWPNFDQRRAQALARQVYPEVAVARIKEQIPGVQIDFDDLLGTPKYVRSTRGFLSEPELISDQSKWPPLPPGVQPMPSQPKPDISDHYRTLKKFLNENNDLFGYDASILETARITRESTTPHNQLRTVVWQQALDGIPIFEAILIANFSRSDALVSLSSQFIPDLSHVTRSSAQSISAADAVALAVVNIGGDQIRDFEAMDEPAGSERKQKFTGDSLVGEAETSLVNGINPASGNEATPMRLA